MTTPTDLCRQLKTLHTYIDTIGSRTYDEILALIDQIQHLAPEDADLTIVLTTARKHISTYEATRAQQNQLTQAGINASVVAEKADITSSEWFYRYSEYMTAQCYKVDFGFQATDQDPPS